jgi:hypothetical protein
MQIAAKESIRKHRMVCLSVRAGVSAGRVKRGISNKGALHSKELVPPPATTVFQRPTPATAGCGSGSVHRSLHQSHWLVVSSTLSQVVFYRQVWTISSSLFSSSSPSSSSHSNPSSLPSSSASSASPSSSLSFCTNSCA